MVLIWFTKKCLVGTDLLSKLGIWEATGWYGFFAPAAPKHKLHRENKSIVAIQYPYVLTFF